MAPGDTTVGSTPSMESRRFRGVRLKTVSMDLDKVPAWLNSSPAIYQPRVVLCGVSPGMAAITRDQRNQSRRAP